jgi:hypothetical protein
MALVAGNIRVPKPATGKTAFNTFTSIPFIVTFGSLQTLTMMSKKAKYIALINAGYYYTRDTDSLNKI